MVMLIDAEDMSVSIGELEEKLRANVENMEIHVMHEEIFNSMHRV
jgi:ACT domain-containing protein